MLKRILLVDDDPRVTQSLRRVLRKEDCTTLEAHSAKEARRLLEEQTVDIIICDEKMPDMNGTELLTLVQQRFPDTIRIILTGHASLETAIRAINQGQVYRFLTKPCQSEELIATIRQGAKHLELLRQSSRLLRTVKRQTRLLEDVERRHPGITRQDQGTAPPIEVAEESKDFDQILCEIESAINSAL